MGGALPMHIRSFIIEELRKGDSTLLIVSRQHGLSYSTVRKLWKRYKAEGDGTKALKLTQYGSEVMHAEPNDASVELGYRSKSDVASGVMIHVGGVYEHSDGSTSCAASEGCFGVMDGKSSDTNPSNDYSNKILGAIIEQADKSETNKGKIEVIIQNAIHLKELIIKLKSNNNNENVFDNFYIILFSDILCER